jgi:hypothetical protein
MPYVRHARMPRKRLHSFRRTCTDAGQISNVQIIGLIFSIQRAMRRDHLAVVPGAQSHTRC